MKQAHTLFKGLTEMTSVEDDVFLAESDDIGTPNIFGGQALGQAVSAAYQTLPAGKRIHSLHAYFLSAGRHQPIRYEVDRLRDGASYAARRVTARQGESVIFEAMVSAQEAETGLEYQVSMPVVPGPEGLQSEFEYRQSVRDQWPEILHGRLLAPRGIEYRRVQVQDILHPKPYAGTTHIWLRAMEPLPDTPMAHHAFLAYASDHGPLLSAIAPYDLSLVKGEVRLASLDHAIWFHRDFRLDDWLLYEIDCTNIGGGRALCKGQLYQDGRLVATVAQEGLMRVRRDMDSVHRA